MTDPEARMLRLDTSDSPVVSLRFIAVALFLANCSPTAEPVGPQGGSTSTGKGGDSSTNGGTNSGSGGSTTTGNGGTTSTGMGGSNTSMGGAKGGTTSTNGGSSTTNGGSSTTNGGSSTGTGGSTTTGSGGSTTTGSGGSTTTGSGGSTTASCTTYPGTGKDSTIFVDGFGTAKTGKWSGYVFSYPYGTATIAPNSKAGTSCFHGAKVCAAGSVPADYDSGAAVGWNIGQMMGGSTNTAVAITGSVKITVSGATAGMRFNLAPETGMNYCYTLTAADATAAASGLTLTAKSFAQTCYDTAKATPYAGAAIASIQVEMPGDKAAGAKTFDFCLIDFEPG